MITQEGLIARYGEIGCPVITKDARLASDYFLISNLLDPAAIPAGLTQINAAHIFIVFEQDGEFYTLLNRDKQVSHFNLPGGGIENGETPRDTIIREPIEELGLNLTHEELIDLGMLVFGSVHCPLYLCDITDSELPNITLDLDSDAIAILSLKSILAGLPQSVQDRIQEAICQLTSPLDSLNMY